MRIAAVQQSISDDAKSKSLPESLKNKMADSSSASVCRVTIGQWNVPRAVLGHAGCFATAYTPKPPVLEGFYMVSEDLP